jgi:hypothetical protein
MRVFSGPAGVAAAAALGLAMTGMAASASASALPADAGYVALAASTIATHAPRVGTYTSSRMSVEVALAPRDEAGL